MLRIELSSAQRSELHIRTRQRGLAPQTRDRLEMVRLVDAGWSVPRIARLLGRHEQTVRKHVQAFLAHGFAALPDRPRAGRPPTVTDEHLRALEGVLDAGGRTWTARQLADWLERERGVGVHPDHLRRRLQARGFRWKRTATSLTHKQADPALQAAKAAELEGLKKGGPARGARLVVLGSERLRPDAADQRHLGAGRDASGRAV